MRTITVPIPGHEYDILINPGILHKIDTWLDPNDHYVIITDDYIPKQYCNTIQSILPKHLVLEIPYGETSKRLDVAENLIHRMLENGVTRSSKVISLGGGVVGDLAGFVASIYMRGIDYIQIPTTLLSQIDSSVGGKVGVNTTYMKNAIGAFKQPRLVLIDSNTLKTLDKKQINSGIAEMIKYGLISSKSLFEDLKSLDVLADIDPYIEQCVRIKKDIVVQDEFDHGIRQLLNYGHTIGHAIEQYSNYAILHGEAIAIGMAKMSIGMSHYDDLLELLRKYDLPTSYDYDKEQLYQYITTDKKASGDDLNIILVEKVGNGYIQRIKINEIKSRL